MTLSRPSTRVCAVPTARLVPSAVVIGRPPRRVRSARHDEVAHQRSPCSRCRGSGAAAASSASAAAREASRRSAGRPGQHALRRARARHGRDATAPKASRTSRTTPSPDVERGGDRADARRRTRRARGPCGSGSGRRPAAGGRVTPVISAPGRQRGLPVRACRPPAGRSSASGDSPRPVGGLVACTDGVEARPARPPCRTGGWPRSARTRPGRRGCGARPRSRGSPLPGSRLLQGLVTSAK